MTEFGMMCCCRPVWARRDSETGTFYKVGCALLLYTYACSTPCTRVQA